MKSNGTPDPFTTLDLSESRTSHCLPGSRSQEPESSGRKALPRAFMPLKPAIIDLSADAARQTRSIERCNIVNARAALGSFVERLTAVSAERRDQAGPGNYHSSFCNFFQQGVLSEG